jgi:serine/threonine protein kinase
MHFAFQDFENLYLVMDLLNGGDLRYHLSKNKNFTEEQTSI